MTVFQIGPMTLEIREGDISTIDVDAIVNAANSQLWMGSGVAGALKARGGIEIEREAIAQGPIKPGEAVVTGAGRLQAQRVIHAAVMGPDLRTDETLIREATSSALALADREQLRSVAFPALGTGVGAFPLERCAKIMIDVVRAHAGVAGSVQRVVIVLHGQDAYRVFEEVALKSGIVLRKS